MDIAIYHNIMWSKYKGGVFSAIHEAVKGTATTVSFTQIAETESDRVALGGVDPAFHRYPYELIFKGNYYGPSLAKRVGALVSRAWRSKADIVVLPGYERPEYWAMLFTLILRGKPRAVFCDSTAYDRPNTFWKSVAKRFFFTRCHGFFGYGIRSREYLMMHGADSRHIFYRCQAAALPLSYDPAEALQTRLAAAPAVGAPPRFLYVGRLSHEKGLDTLIYALAKLRRSVPAAEVALVGAGPLKGELEQLAKLSGVADAVHFLGSMSIDKLANEYAASTALVLPSTSEPWGLVVNEALSYGCPVVVSNICGCVPELVLDGKSGFSFQANSVDDLAKAMSDTVAQLSENVPATAKFCIDLMHDYSPQKAAQQIIEGCRKILMLKQPA